MCWNSFRAFSFSAAAFTDHRRRLGGRPKSFFLFFPVVPFAVITFCDFSLSQQIRKIRSNQNRRQDRRTNESKEWAKVVFLSRFFFSSFHHFIVCSNEVCELFFFFFLSLFFFSICTARKRHFKPNIFYIEANITCEKCGDVIEDINSVGRKLPYENLFKLELLLWIFPFFSICFRIGCFEVRIVLLSTVRLNLDEWKRELFLFFSYFFLHLNVHRWQNTSRYPLKYLLNLIEVNAIGEKKYEILQDIYLSRCVPFRHVYRITYFCVHFLRFEFDS